MKSHSNGPILITLAVLCGCTNLSGYQGSSQYACAAPDGVACDSISGVYANALQQRLPSQQRSLSAAQPTPNPAPAVPTAPTSSMAQMPALTPLRSSTRIMRLWVKPWEDRDGDLHDQSFVYVRIDDGRWLLEHVQQQVRDAYAPLRPPPAPASPATEPNATRQPVGLPAPMFDTLLEPLSSEPESLP